MPRPIPHALPRSLTQNPSSQPPTPLNPISSQAFCHVTLFLLRSNSSLHDNTQEPTTPAHAPTCKAKLIAMPLARHTPAAKYDSQAGASLTSRMLYGKGTAWGQMERKGGVSSWLGDRYGNKQGVEQGKHARQGYW